MATAHLSLPQGHLWTDIQPIPQDDGPDPLVPIMYSEQYRTAMDYFRAVSASGEKSERVLELTETIIRMNPAHYTVWRYRMATLLVLDKDLEVELELMNEFARENLKSYQVWHHRLLLLEKISPEHPTKEIDYAHDSLIPDPKNYHTWAYLHWLYSHFSSLSRISEPEWAAEQAWCDEMLRTDGRNNSAWGWRWYLRIARPGAPGGEDGGKEEIHYALRAIHKIPHNVSAWNYLRGLLKHFQLPMAPLLPAVLPYTAREGIAALAQSPDAALPLPSEPLPPDTPLPISHALEYLADTLVQAGKGEQARAVYLELGTTYDKMRAAYWHHRASSV